MGLQHVSHPWYQVHAPKDIDVGRRPATVWITEPAALAAGQGLALAAQGTIPVLCRGAGAVSMSRRQNQDGGDGRQPRCSGMSKVWVEGCSQVDRPRPWHRL